MPGYLVRRLQQLATATFSDELAEYDLTAVQFAALVAIAETPGLDATRLAELIVLDRATIGDVIARLERKGLIVREQGTHDKRTKLLAPSPAARPLIERCFTHVENVQIRMLAPLSADEREALLGLMTKLVLAADETGKPAQQY